MPSKKTRLIIALLQAAAVAIGCAMILKLDFTTRLNSATLVAHSAKLAAHDKNFESILEGTFSPEFALHLRRYLNNVGK